ncbi:cysteine desulfurase family protein [Flavisolibacter ginsengisoli]|jgi:cysteine desulfurase|uniref:cysteine desulfurase n=1 Tax=Flavisolibacter ginsengisoli DSM 18119 TaxID=1121884 RepID=A0A1M4UK38_9BACT|nr:cysteine desulfurase family protein [Flavisolibacter ginsengisoli]SHE57142.1 cysteine desulfurase [Flavisolibacter ginsengisoli DSM 18119]
MPVTITDKVLKNSSLPMNDTRIYFDNAATTALSPEVLEAMLPYMKENFGNPSSIYSYGRETRLAIENARKSVAKALGVKPGSIFFTSGGTESNNTAIAASIRDLGCSYIITSQIEHHAVLHTVEHYGHTTNVEVSYVKLKEDGHIDLVDLESQLEEQTEKGHKCLVSLMHANNEIGVLLPIKKVGELCQKYNAIFHSDCVQTVGHYPINLSEIHVHFISASSHKFHGPKGVGILYVNEDINIKPFIFGGGQERNMRAGTENVYGIVGFAKALDIAMDDYEKESNNIRKLKLYMAEKIKENIPGVSFNCGDDALYTVLSVCFPKTDHSEFLLMNLDINNICASGGSACSSGANAGSHVMKALHKEDHYTTVRFSFSKYNTIDEVDKVVEKLKELL